MSYRYGEPDLDRLQRAISSERFTELLAYERINPHGEVRDDARMARICATFVNMMRDSKSAAVKESLFMLDFEPPKEETGEEHIAWARQFAAAAGQRKEG